MVFRWETYTSLGHISLYIYIYVYIYIYGRGPSWDLPFELCARLPGWLADWIARCLWQPPPMSFAFTSRSGGKLLIIHTYMNLCKIKTSLYIQMWQIQFSSVERIWWWPSPFPFRRVGASIHLPFTKWGPTPSLHYLYVYINHFKRWWPFPDAIRFSFREWWQAPHYTHSYESITNKNKHTLYNCGISIFLWWLGFGGGHPLSLLGKWGQPSAFSLGSDSNPHHNIVFMCTYTHTH